MATITKLKSGNYRIRKMYNGKVYATTLDYKPKDKEAERFLNNLIEAERTPCKERMTFKTAAQRLILSRENIYSPATVAEYNRAIHRMSDSFTSLLVSNITNDIIQREINAYALNHSPKSVKNQYGLIRVVIKSVRPTMEFNITLPQTKKQDFFVPEEAEVKMILDAIKGSKYEVPIILGSFGLRRSEICALTPDDIDGNDIIVNKAKVMNKEKGWSIKTTKTTDSTRRVTVPAYVIELIKQQGYVYHGHPQNISRYMKRIEKELGIESFTLHKLRHYFCSSAVALNIPSDYIMQMGGWSSPHIMKKVYTHSQKKAAEENRKKYSEHIQSLF